MVMPDNFYSTTNNATQIYYDGSWVDVEGMMMDKCIVVDTKERHCVQNDTRYQKGRNDSSRRTRSQDNSTGTSEGRYRYFSIHEAAVPVSVPHNKLPER